MRKRKKSKKIVCQDHHISYEPEIKVRIRRSEHWVITLLSRFNSLSAGSKKAIRHILKTKKTLRLLRKTT
jgi:hypothetical protein